MSGNVRLIETPCSNERLHSFELLSGGHTSTDTASTVDALERTFQRCMSDHKFFRR